MSSVALPRWAVSFADLILLLLGCFVMLHAIESARPKAAAGFNRASLAESEAVRAAALFEAGEARLTPAGETVIGAAAQRWPDRNILLVSHGAAEGSDRLDRFELAAARAAAVARSLRNHGVHSEIGIEMNDAPAAVGQTIEIAPR